MGNDLKIRLGTRGSALAMVQARAMARALEESGTTVEIVIMNTIGDQDKTSSFATLGPPGVFVREIEVALQKGAIDLAVHCYKDLPSISPGGLVIAAIPGREDAREVLVIAEHAFDRGQPGLPIKHGLKVGTSAARRRAVIAHKRADLVCEELRGNVPTRLAKLQRGDYDAIVLAAAGLNRLAEGAARGENDKPDLTGVICQTLSAVDFVPAPSQGALALQVREPGNDDRDKQIFTAVRAMHCPDAERGITAERELLRLIQAGCDSPFGAWADVDGEDLTLHGIFADEGGLRSAAVSGTDPIAVAEQTVRALGLGEFAISKQEEDHE